MIEAGSLDWALAKFIKANAVAILLPYRMSMYIMTLYAVFGIGYSLAKSYDLDGLSGAIMAELTFLLTVVPASIPDVTDSIAALATKNAELNAFLQQLPSGYVISAEHLGSAGMFIGIISAFIGVEVYRFTQVKGLKITMPAAVPPAVARSFESLTPTIIIILGISTLTMWLGVDVHSIVGTSWEYLSTQSGTAHARRGASAHAAPPADPGHPAGGTGRPAVSDCP